MNRIKSLCGVAALSAVVISTNTGCRVAAAQQHPEPNRQIDLTVYKDDFALVSEQRPVNVEAGHSRLAIDNVSKKLDPASVLFDWPHGQSHPQVVSTTYDLGVGAGSSLMSRLNGQEVDMTWMSNEGKPGDTVSGRLEVAADGNTFAIRTDKQLYVNPTGTIVAPAASTASSLPQLAVEVENPAAAHSRLGVSYLTRGMSWSADYVARLQPKSDKVELECWATITNTTGIAFPLAKLTLMAGSPNRSVDRFASFGGESLGLSLQSGVENSVNGNPVMANAMRMPVGESYAYQIPSTATIGQDQMNRVSVLGTREVPITRDYAVRLPQLSASGLESYDGRSNSHRPAVLSIQFANIASSHLGVPLPAGAVRVYETDRTGHERYTGAASIADTPKRESVSLTLSDSFDLYADCRVVQSKRMSKHVMRKIVEVNLHNEKSDKVLLRVVQPVEATAAQVTETIPSMRLNQNLVQWQIDLKPGEDKKMRYAIDVRW